MGPWGLGSWVWRLGGHAPGSLCPLPFMGSARSRSACCAVIQCRIRLRQGYGGTGRDTVHPQRVKVSQAWSKSVRTGNGGSKAIQGWTGRAHPSQNYDGQEARRSQTGSNPVKPTGLKALTINVRFFGSLRGIRVNPGKSDRSFKKNLTADGHGFESIPMISGDFWKKIYEAIRFTMCDLRFTDSHCGQWTQIIWAGRCGRGSRGSQTRAPGSEPDRQSGRLGAKKHKDTI
jgi:hypothetical protein